MPENARLNGWLDDIDVDVVEREATLRLFMILSILFYLTELSFSNITTIFEISGVERERSTVHNWEHTAELQPED